MFLGLNITAWTAILALVTVVALGVTVWFSVSERRRDDTRRKEDRDRDDRLRLAAAEELERRDREERTAREDYEARQVTVITGDGKVVVSSPLEYPIKGVWMALVSADSSNLSVSDEMRFDTDPWIPRQADTPIGRTYYRFPVSFDNGEKPIVRFVDWHGNQYYQYRHYTERFGQNTDFLEAATKIDEWIRTGPKPD